MATDLPRWVQAGALVVAGAFAGYRFWYQDYYVPRNDPPTVDVEVELQRQPAQNNLIPVLLKATAHNKSRFPARVFNSAFAVLGSKVTAGIVPPPGAHDPGSAPYQAFSAISAPIVIASGRLWMEASWLEPNQQATASALIYVPRDGRFDTIEAHVMMRAARDGSLFRIKQWTFDPHRGWDVEREVLANHKWEQYQQANAAHLRIAQDVGARTYMAESALSLW